MKTRYVVLREAEEAPHGWELLDAVVASSAETAIRAFAENLGDGTYCAVPERSWTQRTVKVETTTRVVLGSGS